MRTALLTTAAAITAGAFLAGSSDTVWAHASLETPEVAANSMYKAVMRIPHGCDGEPTTTLTIDIPDGVIVAKPMPKAGWKTETVWGSYDKAYDYYGAPKTEGVRRIVWSGGNLRDDFYDEFVFRARITGGLAGHSIAFPTVQDCADGSQVAWTQIPNAGQDPHDLKNPAPLLTVVASKTQGHGGHGGHGSHGAHGDVTVEKPFARATAGPARNGAAYLTIKNDGDHADRLISAKADVSERVELHTHLHENGVMKMRKVEAIEIPAKGLAMLKPGGDHVMFMGLKAPLVEGQSFPLTLILEKAGEIQVMVTVGTVGAMGMGDDHTGHGSHKSGGHGTHKSN